TLILPLLRTGIPLGFFGHVEFLGQPPKCEVAHTSLPNSPLKVRHGDVYLAPAPGGDTMAPKPAPARLASVFRIVASVFGIVLAVAAILAIMGWANSPWAAPSSSPISPLQLPVSYYGGRPALYRHRPGGPASEAGRVAPLVRHSFLPPDAVSLGSNEATYGLREGGAGFHRNRPAAGKARPTLSADIVRRVQNADGVRCIR